MKSGMISLFEGLTKSENEWKKHEVKVAKRKKYLNEAEYQDAVLQHKAPKPGETKFRARFFGGMFSGGW